MKNIALPNYEQVEYILIGRGTDGSRGHVSSGVTIKNVSANYGSPGGQQLGRGPCLEAWGYFFIFDRITCGGAEIPFQPASGAAVRSGGTVTVTTPAANDFYLGQWVTYWGPTDGTFQGNFRITAATPTTVSWSQPGPNATTGGGYLYGDRSFGISLNQAGVDTVVTNLTFGSGGVRVNGGGNCGVVMENISGDAPFAWEPPAVEFTAGNAAGLCQASIKGAGTADEQGTNLMPAVVNWGSGSSVSVEAVGGALGGNINNVGTLPHADCSSSLGAQNRGQVGFFCGQVQGQDDAARRVFPPVAARFPNLVNSNPTQWSDNTTGFVPGSIGRGTLVTGLSAPDGTNGAASYIANRGSSFLMFYGQSGILNVGETWLGGAWVRFPQGGTQALTMGLVGWGYGSGAYCDGGSQNVYVYPYEGGDGQWFWVQVACTVWANPNGVGFGFGIYADATHHVQVYAPTLIHIPAGTLSGNEYSELLRNFAPNGPNAVAGDVSPLPSQRFGITSGTNKNPTLGYLTHNNTANRTYTFPNATGNVCVSGVSCGAIYSATYNTQTNCNVNSASPAACGSAPSGSVVVPATTKTYTINTSAVTANSRIHVWPITDNSGLSGSPTCTTPSRRPRHRQFLRMLCTKTCTKSRKAIQKLPVSR